MDEPLFLAIMRTTYIFVYQERAKCNVIDTLLLCYVANHEIAKLCKTYSSLYQLVDGPADIHV